MKTAKKITLGLLLASFATAPVTTVKAKVDATIPLATAKLILGAFAFAYFNKLASDNAQIVLKPLEKKIKPKTKQGKDAFRKVFIAGGTAFIGLTAIALTKMLNVGPDRFEKMIDTFVMGKSDTIKNHGVCCKPSEETEETFESTPVLRSPAPVTEDTTSRVEAKREKANDNDSVSLADRILKGSPGAVPAEKNSPAPADNHEIIFVEGHEASPAPALGASVGSSVVITDATDSSAPAINNDQPENVSIKESSEATIVPSVQDKPNTNPDTN